MYIPLTFEGALQKCLFASASRSALEGYFISGSRQYAYHWFTGSGNLVVQKGTIDNVEIYVIGGGGGGGLGSALGVPAGGGGGGGVTYTLNGRLYQGTYNVTVGAGGIGAPTASIVVDGGNGSPSSFTGPNLSMVANGGTGGQRGTLIYRGGTSGNGFLGGLNAGNTQGGGGGGGATAAGVDGSSTAAGDGGAGVTITIDGVNTYGFGCGGGGYAPDTSLDAAYSCNGTGPGRGGEQNNPAQSGSNFYGMGGGAGSTANSGSRSGGSGSVLIKYPIFDYCSNFFNETGSCDCRQLTFDIPNIYGFSPTVSGSYMYMPCGGTQFVSGTFNIYAEKTVCAVSESYYAFSYKGPTLGELFVRNGLVEGYLPECTTQSLVPIPCAVESFIPTCTSSVVTVWTPSGSVSTVNFLYVAKNESTHSVYTSTSDTVNYICLSTGSYFNDIAIYPQILTGNFATLINGASCANTGVTASWAGKAAGASSSTYHYYACNGSRTSVTFTRPTTTFTGSLSASLCIDSNTPTFFTRTGTITANEFVNTGGSCIENFFSASACGCP